jgi:hypothetical protein
MKYFESDLNEVSIDIVDNCSIILFIYIFQDKVIK